MDQSDIDTARLTQMSWSARILVYEMRYFGDKRSIHWGRAKFCKKFKQRRNSSWTLNATSENPKVNPNEAIIT